MTVYAKSGSDMYAAFDSEATFKRFVWLYAHGDLAEGEAPDFEAANEHWTMTDGSDEGFKHIEEVITAEELGHYSETDYDIAQDLHELVSTTGWYDGKD